MEIPINANDEQLLEISLALDEYTVAGFLRGDGLNLNKLPGNYAVRTGFVWPVTAKAEFDLGVDFTEFSPDL